MWHLSLKWISFANMMVSPKQISATHGHGAKLKNIIFMKTFCRNKRNKSDFEYCNSTNHTHVSPISTICCIGLNRIIYSKGWMDESLLGQTEKLSMARFYYAFKESQFFLSFSTRKKPQHVQQIYLFCIKHRIEVLMQHKKTYPKVFGSFRWN